ncbi:FMN-binding protein [Fluviicoccus keumensis]|uniref:FMN-binding protein n=1 Tax=Fluviicoccus keumensis TaxID=1435465 RepID=A0A4Q7Z4P5_9GAMM|nr:FMN-binding protein [Fluviicoccus keumensis]RZU44954.1 FMN-binding protein [Fluviicoccus keumensis]
MPLKSAVSLMLVGLLAAAVPALAADPAPVSRLLPGGEQKMLWLTPELKQRVEGILGHAYAGLRVRYWQAGGRTAWVLDEVGKEQPITAGITIEQGHIVDMQVLAYRESRGGEVQQPFFTRQFNGATLNGGKDMLDRRVDGITGATLSVNAMQKMARVALLLDSRRSP